jgi:hypothetical protein
VCAYVCVCVCVCMCMPACVSLCMALCVCVYVGFTLRVPAPQQNITQWPHTPLPEQMLTHLPQTGKGDAIVFVSHKYHCVKPVTAGRRNVSHFFCLPCLLSFHFFCFASINFHCLTVFRILFAYCISHVLVNVTENFEAIFTWYNELWCAYEICI